MATHDYHWTFGQGCHIHFPNGGDPVALPQLPTFSTGEGCATFCDANGDLLFYTDGRTLFDSTHAVLSPLPPATSLGGSPSSTHSAIIVPPAGGGSLYHIFAVHDWNGPPIGPVFHTAIEISPKVKVASPTTPLPDAAFQSSERLAAIPHADPGNYWVVCMEGKTNLSGSPFLAIPVDSDAAPDVAKIITSAYPYAGSFGYCIKFSPDGSLIAIVSTATIDLLNFDRATGKITEHSQITGLYTPSRAKKHVNSPFNKPYGVEFSPNGKYLYFSDIYDGYVRRHTIGVSKTPPTPLASTYEIRSYDAKEDDQNYPVGALQLAPNGKIYGTRPNARCLLEIAHPEDATLPATAATVGFKDVAIAADGKDLALQGIVALGLPTFTRIPEIKTCEEIAAEVNELIGSTGKLNRLRPCRGDQALDLPACAPLALPTIAPWTSIRWGDSECDCIEGDDTEVMNLTVCNPYRNLTLSNLTIHQIVVVQANGAPVLNLPDGTPSVQLVPMGPYCFDDLAPCVCVTRQFVLRLRGAVPGPYRILLRGICFDACFHGDEEDCFIFQVCKD